MKRILLILLSLVSITACTSMPNSKWEGNIRGKHLIMDFYSKGRVELYDMDHKWITGGFYKRNGELIEFNSYMSVYITSKYESKSYQLVSARIDKKRMSVKTECDGAVYYDTLRKIE
jgi:hypothetical protein